VTADQWIDRFAAELGTERPSAEDVEQLLALAAVAAHASERTAAPISCYLAARSGRSVSEVARIAADLAAGP